MFLINLKVNKKIVIALRLIAFISLICLIALLVLYFSGWLSSYQRINQNNIDDCFGNDLWKNVIEKFDDVEIDNLPLKSQSNSISDYTAVLKIKNKDKSKWLEISKNISSYISDYLNDNPKCELNSFDSINVKIKYNTDANSVAFSNKYDFGESKEKLDGLCCVRVSSDNDTFISLADISQFDNAEYMIVNVKVDESTDFSVLSELTSVKELNIFVEDNFKAYAENQIEALNLSYDVSIL